MPALLSYRWFRAALQRCLIVLVLPFWLPWAGQAEDIVIDTTPICPGADYLHKRVKSVPWSIHILRFERNHPELNITTTLPSGELLGLSPATVQMKFIPVEAGKPIGAINGDFFSWRRGPYQGDVSGLQIINGEVASAPHFFSDQERGAPLGSIAFWIDANGNPHLDKIASRFEVTWPDGRKTPFLLNQTGEESEVVLHTHVAGFSTRTTNGIEFILTRDAGKPWLPLAIGETYSARVSKVGGTNNLITKETPVLWVGAKLASQFSDIKTGSVLSFSTVTAPFLQNVKTAIGGGPWLVHNGKRAKFGNDPERHPRAAMGWNDTHYFFVISDGRREGIGMGMSYFEMADEMVRLGCKEALNLDGGGSAMLWVDGQIRSQPSENRERPCANALVLLRKTR